MKRYALFAGDDYYPSGGWHDFRRFADTLEEARPNQDRDPHWDWWHVVDTSTGKVVAIDIDSQHGFESYLPELVGFLPEVAREEQD